jgi:hypothetical protein
VSTVIAGTPPRPPGLRPLQNVPELKNPGTGRDAPAVILGTGTTVTRSRQARERRTAQGPASQGALAVATGKDH